jgi:hypothetical protein
VALTWGVSWKTSDEAASFSAGWTGQTAARPAACTTSAGPVTRRPRQFSPATARTGSLPGATPDVDIACRKKRALLRKQQQREE